jgi:hypothetical protein
MNDLIQSLPSPLPTAGITHTWMAESWMVDGIGGASKHIMGVQSLQDISFYMVFMHYLMYITL